MLIQTLLAAILLATAFDETPAQAWVKAHAVAIRTADLGADDVSDLAPLAAAIGDARVVMIGEPSHGDGAGFVLRGRILEYLHEHMGFDVIAFESGTFDCDVMMDKLRSEMPTDEALSYGVFSIWGASDQCRPFFEYARSTLKSERPLELAGVDLQFSGRGGEDFETFVETFLAGPAAGAVDDATKSNLTKAIARLFKPPYTPTEEQLARDQAAIAATITQLRAQQDAIVAKQDARRFEFVVRCLENASLQSELRLLMTTNADPLKIGNLRDQRMGDNLVWFANERYAGKKIVVWSANGHCAHDVKRADTNAGAADAPKRVSMGDVAHKALGDELYTIALTARVGSFGMVNQPATELTAAPAGSLEDAIGALGIPYAFVDLRATRGDATAWSNSKFVARPFQYAAREAPWATMLDGFLVVDQMTPSTLPKP